MYSGPDACLRKLFLNLLPIADPHHIQMVDCFGPRGLPGKSNCPFGWGKQFRISAGACLPPLIGGCKVGEFDS